MGKHLGKHSLRKQLTFHEVASRAIAKWCLSNKCRNSILMMCTTQILVVLLTGWNLFQPIRSITLIWVVDVISMEFLHSLLRRHFARAQVATSWNVGCFLRLRETCFCKNVSATVFPHLQGPLWPPCYYIFTLLWPKQKLSHSLSENHINLNTHQSKQGTTFGVPHSYQCFF